MTRPGGDDVVIRVGSTPGNRAGFVNLARDVAAATGDVDDLRRELQQLAAQDANPEVAIRAADALADLERAETALRQFDGMTAEAAAQVNAETGDLDRALAALRQADGETARMRVEVDTDGAESEISGMGSRLGGAARSLGQGMGQAVGSALMEAVGGAIQESLEKEVSSANLAARLVGDPAAMQQAGNSAGALWAQGYGESLDDVNMAVFNVMQSSQEMRTASEADLTRITGLAMDLAKTWDLDVSESMRAASQLVRNGLVPDTVGGLGLINAAMNELGPNADDFLDTVTEYGTQFRALGLSGDDAFKMVSAALAAGARDTDTAADALKEFTLLAQGMGTNTAAAYEKLGISSKKMQADIAAGGDTARNALDLALDRLRAVKDPAERASIAVGLFGTKAEDMQQALYALDVQPATNAFDEYGKKLQEVSQIQGDTTSNHIAQVQRGATSVISSMWGASDGTQSAVGAAVGAIGLWNDIFGTTQTTAAATSDGVVSSAERAAAGMVGGFGRGVSGAAQAVAGLPGRIAPYLGGLFGQGSKAGTDLADGMRGGIMARIQGVANAAQQLAARALNAIRGMLRTGSPSKETRDVGHDFGDGAVLGIDDRVNDIISSARGLGRSAVDGLRGAGASMAGSAPVAGNLGAMAVGTGGAGGAEVIFSGGLDSAFATAFMGMVRAGKIQIRATT